MSKYSKEDIIRMAREGDVEFIRMQFTDIFGQLKNVAITVSQIEKAVNNQVMIDGSSIEASPASRRATSTCIPTWILSPSCRGDRSTARLPASSATCTTRTARPLWATRAAC